MSTTDDPPDSLVTAFPEPGHLIRLAYQDLQTAATGDPDQTRLLDVNALPRPWNPSRCDQPVLRAQLIDWLDRVAGWINQDLGWQPADMVPRCWRHHPGLVRDLALLADRRWASETALTSEPMEQWHTTTLPRFLARVRADTTGCITGHRDWPGRARSTRQNM